MNRIEKPLVWMHGEIQTPPFSVRARVEAGYLLRLLQIGQSVTMPHSRPMPSVGVRCHELRVSDCNKHWRIFYRVDLDAIVILDVLEKKTRKTPKAVLEICRKRLKSYDEK